MTVRIIPKFIRDVYTKRRHARKGSFTPGKPYKVHGFDHDDRGNGYVILMNNYNELWWVNNRHVRGVTA